MASNKKIKKPVPCTLVSDLPSSQPVNTINEELAFQIAEKEKRAAELILANIELAYQSTEKEKRAAELVIAIEELAFQNREKEKRAAELAVANKELAFQNEEKEKRAAELAVLNEELIKSFKEKETALNRISDGVVSVDNDWRYTFLNEAFKLPHPLGKMGSIGKVIWDIHPEMKDTIFWDKYHEAMETKKVVEVEGHYESMKIWFAVKIYPSADGLTIFYKDISERKKTEQTILELNESLEKKIAERTAQLESANNEMESFSYSVAHDLRSPVRAMHGYATMLHEDYDSVLDGEGMRLISEIIYNAKTMGILIDDLLTFSRLGRKEISISSIDMNQLAETCLTDLDHENRNAAKITVHSLLPVFADPSLMKNVMMNLISNALKYSSKKEHPVIELKSMIEDGNVHYSVKDNGVGFNMEFSDKLFGVFQRLHSDEEFEGTGVGLAIVKRIILKHGGKVWASAVENEGATFSFSLPNKQTT